MKEWNGVGSSKDDVRAVRLTYWYALSGQPAAATRTLIMYVDTHPHLWAWRPSVVWKRVNQTAEHPSQVGERIRHPEAP